MVWVTSPSGLYRMTECIDVMLGLALVPVVLVMLSSVISKLFVWPRWRSVASLLGRLSLALVVGGVIFAMTTGILNIEYSNPIRLLHRSLLRRVGVHGRLRDPHLRGIRRDGPISFHQTLAAPQEFHTMCERE